MGLGTMPWGSLGQRHVLTPFPKMLPCWAKDAPSIPPNFPPNTLCWTWDFPFSVPPNLGDFWDFQSRELCGGSAVRRSDILLLKVIQGLHLD